MQPWTRGSGGQLGCNGTCSCRMLQWETYYAYHDRGGPRFGLKARTTQSNKSPLLLWQHWTTRGRAVV